MTEESASLVSRQKISTVPGRPISFCSTTQGRVGSTEGARSQFSMSSTSSIYAKK